MRKKLALAAIVLAIPTYALARIFLGLGMTPSTGVGPLTSSSFEQHIATDSASGLVAYYPLAYDMNDASTDTVKVNPVAASNITYSGPTPAGMNYSIDAYFNGTSSQIRYEGSSYPFQLSTWTVTCWFKQTSTGTTTSTSGGADGFPSGDPIIPLVTKGRGEGETAGINCNWFLGINKVSNGTTYRLGADFEESTGPNHKLVGTTNIMHNQWYFAAYTMEWANGVPSERLYLNGVQESTATMTVGPDTSSTQKMGIGTAYTSASAAAGFFQGHLSNVAIWNTAKSADEILAMYNKGIASYRKIPTYTADDTDNEITHGTNNANWTAGGTGSSVNTSSITVAGGGGYAYISVSGLSANTTYWASILISSRTADSNAAMQVAALGTQSATISGTGGAALNVCNSTTTYKYYFQVVTNGSASPHRFVITYPGNTSAAKQHFTGLNIYSIPSRSTAAIALLGDREGNFNAARGTTVDNAILDASHGNINVYTVGDLAETTRTYAANNFVLKDAIEALGGRIYPVLGNHDYDGANETIIISTFSAEGYNEGLPYYTVALGETRLYSWDDNTNAYNLGGFNVAVTTQQYSTQGAYMLREIASNRKKWPIFILHHPPYSSIGSGSNTNNRWDFSSLGVPIVFAGHNHGLDRTVDSNVTYMTIARGGSDHHGYGSTLAGTRWVETDNTISGFLKIYDGDSSMILEYYDTNGVMRDRTKITRSES